MSDFKIDKCYRALLVTAFFAAFICFFNQTTINPALPTIIIDFNIEPSFAQWLLSAYLMIMAIMVPVNAFLIERFTVKWLIVLSMTFYTLGCIFTGLGLNFWITLFGRLLQGCGHGILMPTVIAIFLYLFPQEKRGYILGIYGLLVGFAPVLGPTFSGFIVDNLGWHFVFYFIGICSLICLLSCIIFVKPFKVTDTQTVKLDVLSIISCSLGLGILLLGVSEIGSIGFSPLAACALFIGLLITVYFVWRQIKLDIPMLDIKVFKTKKFTISIILMSITQIAFIGAIVLLPFLIQDVLGYSPTTSGLVSIAPSLVIGIMSPVTGKLFDKYGFRFLALFGMAILTISGFCLSILTPSSSLFLLIIFLSLRNFGASFVLMNSNTWGINSLDKAMISNGNAVATTFRQISMSFGSAISICIYSFIANSLPGGILDVDCGIAGINASFFYQACLCATAFVIAAIFVKDSKNCKKLKNINNK